MFYARCKNTTTKTDSREKANGGGSVSLISPSFSFETAAKSAYSSPLRKFPANYNCKNHVAIQAYDADFNDDDSTKKYRSKIWLQYVPIHGTNHN